MRNVTTKYIIYSWYCCQIYVYSFVCFCLVDFLIIIYYSQIVSFLRGLWTFTLRCHTQLHFLQSSVSSSPNQSFCFITLPCHLLSSYISPCICCRIPTSLHKFFIRFVATLSSQTADHHLFYFSCQQGDITTLFSLTSYNVELIWDLVCMIGNSIY